MPETNRVGEALAKIITKGCVVLLCGDLAAGKTTLSRAIFEARGYFNGICSPTFAIINEYKKEDGKSAYHMDLYRIGDIEELEYTGFYDCLGNGEFCVIEWPGEAENVIENDVIKVEIEKTDDFNERIFNIEVKNSAQIDKLREELDAYTCD